MKKLLIFSAFAAAALTGCYNDKYDKLYPTPTTTTCDTSAVSYARDIQPIFNSNCVSCHVSGGTGATYGILTSYDASWWSVSRNRNYIIRDINDANVSDPSHMPQALPSLSTCDINKITAWIDQGYQNN